MNDAFFEMPEEKRNTIIKAALRVFSQHGYKKSPMNEIAAEAGISKSLLFYYFKNKKELYMYLVQYCADISKQEMIQNGCYGRRGFFEVLESGLKVKIGQMRSNPELAMFELKGYFEKDTEPEADVRKLIDSYSGFETQINMIDLDMSEFIEGLDIEMMYRNIYYAAEGYFWEVISREMTDPDEIERGYMKMIDHWKSIYLRREGK